jgi:tRNA (guanine-N7-)-methyltransferase
MSKTKKEKWAEFSTFPNTLEPYDESLELKGRWKGECFNNDHPLFLELACGKAEYAVPLAERYPERNYVAVDIKSDRMWKGAKRAKEKELENVAFLRIQIEHLLDYFAEDEVTSIWLTFPDPFPKRKHRKKRLMHPRFLNYYQHVVEPDGLVHLKTDSEQLFEYSLEQLEEEELTIEQQLRDIYNLPQPLPEALSIQTYYEKQHRQEGRAIYYLCFRITE